MDKITKLPTWAKQMIENLQRDLAYYKLRSEQIQGDAETNTFIERGLNDPLPLPKNSSIKFAVEAGTISVRIKDDYLDVYGSYGINKELAIVPSVSNSIRIKIK